MTGPKLVLYFDIVSPFAYLAFHVVRSILSIVHASLTLLLAAQTSPVFKNCNVTYVPVYLGGIMSKTGNQAPMTVKNKGKWIGKERLRWARQFNIPMADEMPPGFPVNTIPILRALTVIADLYPQELEATIAAIYDASFVKRQLVHTLENAKPILVATVGPGAAEDVLSKATSPEIKQRLIQNTDEAVDSGAFGLPWFIVTNSQGVEEGYWGFDHLGQVCDHLGLERPQSDKVNEGGWKTML